jgi:hypothetical protein
MCCAAWSADVLRSGCGRSRTVSGTWTSCPRSSLSPRGCGSALQRCCLARSASHPIPTHPIAVTHLARRRTQFLVSSDVPIAAAGALRPYLDSPPAYSVYGSLMLKGAVGAATLGDRRSAQGYLVEATRAADVIGDRNDYWFAFDPTNVAIHRAWLSLELGDPSQAIELAECGPYDRLPGELAERRASHLITPPAPPTPGSTPTRPQHR